MTDGVKDFIDQLQQGNNADAGEAFKDVLRMKVGDALDAKRQELAGNMFNGKVEAQPISDPKPEIAGTGTFDQQGNVVPTGNNATADIDLSQPEN